MLAVAAAGAVRLVAAAPSVLVAAAPAAVVGAARGGIPLSLVVVVVPEAEKKTDQTSLSIPSHPWCLTINHSHL